MVRDTRLALEISIIRTYANRILRLLEGRDPLSERVHLSKAGFAGYGVMGLMRGLRSRLVRGIARTHKPADA